MSKIKKVAIIGTGVIGVGWIIRLLAHDIKVFAYDKNLIQKNNLIREIKRALPFVKKLFDKKKINLNNLKFFSSLENTVKEADFIQECAPENYKLKIQLISQISKNCKHNALISSSSSGLLPSRIFSKCKNNKRGIIGHPFNPVYLLPLVEIVPGKQTSSRSLKEANKFYKSISMNPIILKKELPGYLSDRLQEALWREALHIINEGYASTEDLDRAIEDGPGLRYSLMGTFLTKLFYQEQKLPLILIWLSFTLQPM